MPDSPAFAHRIQRRVYSSIRWFRVSGKPFFSISFTLCKKFAKVFSETEISPPEPKWYPRKSNPFCFLPAKVLSGWAASFRDSNSRFTVLIPFKGFHICPEHKTVRFNFFCYLSQSRFQPAVPVQVKTSAWQSRGKRKPGKAGQNLFSNSIFCAGDFSIAISGQALSMSAPRTGISRLQIHRSGVHIHLSIPSAAPIYPHCQDNACGFRISAWKTLWKTCRDPAGFYFLHTASFAPIRQHNWKHPGNRIRKFHNLIFY